MATQRGIDRNNFESWFGSPLGALKGNRDAGFVVAMVAFPLLERYLKQKTREEPNTPRFNRELLTVLPELQSEADAKLFWSIYRHGLLHNVALSRKTHGLSHDKPIVEVSSDGKVWLNPDLFAERVLDIIRADFNTFVQGVPLPQVYPPQPQSVFGSVSWYQGTAMPPGGNTK
jgi:hypothetical protein